MINFGLLAAEIGPVVWSTPAIFNGFRVFAAKAVDRQPTVRRSPWADAYGELRTVGVSQTVRR